MKKTTLTFIIAVLAANLFAQTFPKNGNFESWTGNMPDNWTMLNLSGPVLPDTGYLSPHSVWLTTTYDNIDEIYVGGFIGQTDTVADKPVMLTGFRKGDSFATTTVSDSNGYQIGVKYSACSCGDTAWVYFADTIQYDSSYTGIYYVNITLMGGGGTPISSGHFDSLQLKLSATETDVADTRASETNLTVFPQPAGNTVSVYLSKPVNGNGLNIFDLNGRIISRTLLTGRKTELNTSALENGVYVLVIETGEKNIVRKLIVSHP